MHRGDKLTIMYIVLFLTFSLILIINSGCSNSKYHKIERLPDGTITKEVSASHSVFGRSEMKDMYFERQDPNNVGTKAAIGSLSVQTDPADVIKAIPVGVLP